MFGGCSRIIADIRVPFDRPRDASLRGSPEFAELTQQIWDLLRDEVNTSLATAGGKA